MACCYTARTFFPYKGSGSWPCSPEAEQSRAVLSWGTHNWGVWVGLVQPNQAAMSTGEVGHSRVADSTMLIFERQKTGTHLQLLEENLPVLSEAALLMASHPYPAVQATPGAGGEDTAEGGSQKGEEIESCSTARLQMFTHNHQCSTQWTCCFKTALQTMVSCWLIRTTNHLAWTQAAPQHIDYAQRKPHHQWRGYT